MRVEIEQIQTANVWHFSSAPELRIYALADFFSDDGDYVPRGTVGTDEPHLKVQCTLENDTVQIPTFEIDSTPIDPPAYYTAIFVAGSRKTPYLSNFAVPAEPEATTWPTLRTFQRIGRMRYVNPPLAQLQAMVASMIADALTFRSYGNEVDVGNVALSTDPLDPTFPIAVSTTDPVWQSLLSNPTTDLVINVKDFGAIGDGVVDDTAAIQAAIDSLHTSNASGTIFFPNGTYIVDGALQDIALSNSQIVLPKRSAAQKMIGIRLLGATPPAQAWPTDSGVIIKSTLATGNGAMIGVRASFGASVATANDIAHNGMTYVSLMLENLTFRLPANPTNSCLDLRFLPNVYIRSSVRIDVEGITASLNGTIPDVLCTEPTTATSYGLLTSVDYVPNLFMIDNLTIMGYYNGMRWGELVNADNITFGGCKVGIEMRGGSHCSYAKKLLFVSTAVLLKAEGRDPLFASTPATAPNETHITIEQFDYENSSGLMPWSITTAHISDASHYLFGDITWSSTVFPLLRVGGRNLRLQQTGKPWHSRYPYSNFTGGDLEAANHAVHEIYRGLPVSDDTAVSWLALTNHQSGLTNLLGIIAFDNDAIANGLNKRLAQIYSRTDGAINHGRLAFQTASGGVLADRGFIDRFGNWGLTKFLLQGEGPALTIAGNAIAPTFPCHIVGGAGPLKNITVPDGVVASTGTCMFLIIPSAAWTYDNTGNISTNGTAVSGRVMFAIYVPSQSKWSLSY